MNAVDHPHPSRNRTFVPLLLLGAVMMAFPLITHAQQSRHTASDGAEFDNFGGAVSISDDGQRALVGADLEDPGGTLEQGSAYVFTRDGGSFVQEAKLVADDGAAGDSLAADDEAVSINADGTVALVGAFRDNVDGNANQGSAYVFTRDGSGNWTQEAKLTAESGAAFDQFGSAVSISDDGQRALIGAELDDGADGTTDQGAAYVFNGGSGGWAQEARLSSAALAGKTFPNSGDAVSLSGNGNRALIGAKFDDLSGGDSNDGSAAVFTRDGSGNWTEEATLTAGDAEANDWFGGAVSLSDDGTRALIGAKLEDGSQGTDDQGAAYVFSRDGSGNWTEEAKLNTDAVVGNAFPNFGNAVSLSGDGERALVGALLADLSGNDTNEGSAFVFDRTAGGSWEEGPMITADNAAEADFFGVAVSINENGQQALVGSHFDEVDGNTDQGSFYALGPSSLPVELASFTARRDGDAAELQWRTLSETNNSGFEIQRRTAEEWQKIGFVESNVAAGTTTDAQRYTFHTDDLDYGQHTFRLVQIDMDGSRSVAGTQSTVEIGLESQYKLSQVSPNPVQGEGTVSVTVRETQSVTIALYDALGRRVRVVHDGTLSANETKRVSVDAHTLSNGVYFLRMRGDSFSASRKVVLAR